MKTIKDLLAEKIQRFFNKTREKIDKGLEIG